MFGLPLETEGVVEDTDNALISGELSLSSSSSPAVERHVKKKAWSGFALGHKQFYLELSVM